MGAKFVKKSFSLPPEVDADLTYLSGRVGVTRSALLASFLSEPLHDLRKLVEAVPQQPTPDDVLRLRGRSAELVQQRMDGLRRLENDLFGE